MKNKEGIKMKDSENVFADMENDLSDGFFEEDKKEIVLGESTKEPTVEEMKKMAKNLTNSYKPYPTAKEAKKGFQVIMDILETNTEWRPIEIRPESVDSAGKVSFTTKLEGLSVAKGVLLRQFTGELLFIAGARLVNMGIPEGSETKEELWVIS